MNVISLLSSTVFLIRSGSTASLPGIVSNVGVVVIISLIKAYKEKNRAYIKRINTQAVREEFYSNIFKQSPVGMAIISDIEYAKNEELDDVSINPAYERIVGRTKDELKSISWTNITHPDDLDTDLLYFDQFKKGKIDVYSREKRYIKPDGSVVWVDMLISRFTGPSEKTGDHVCIITDITERKKIEAALKYTNEHVQLTGLHNRAVLESILERDASLRSADKRALICVNLFNMHNLSKRYGYYYAQTMLKKIADSLNAFCNDHCLLFDTNEYRFVFYVKGYKDENELTVFCEKVSETVSSHLYVYGIKRAIGILQINNSMPHDAGDLFKKVMDTSELAADSNDEKESILFFSPQLDRQMTREREVSDEIREIADGIKTDRLYLQYQPIFDIASGQVCGFEALARLNSEKHGLIPPLEFIPIVEKTNMIVPFGEGIIIKALNFLSKLKENGHDTIAVSINVSTIQILENGFADKLLRMITDMRINPENIGIELTESVFATERAEINTVIDALKAAGIKVLIDDFGTGYSSFAREQDLNIDCLKIDKSFIDKLMVLNPGEAITGDIISMAHKLGHCVIAEGVEYEKQLSYLRDHGCDRIQGYLISKPLDGEAALNFLKSTTQQIH
jgi:PAS domain S-box-containing protein